MSVACGAECVLALGCARWLWKRCTYVGSYDSATWPAATAGEFEPVPRLCRLILAIYEPDLRNPQYYKPATGYQLNPDWVIKRVKHEDTLGHAPPYLIYVDHDHKEIVLAVRGLNLAKESDYKLLLDNKLGKQMFDGGYVHHGLLKSAVWLLNQESETLKKLWEDNGSEYDMVFVGHSLGSGVVSLLTILVVNHRERLGGIPKEKIRCYAIAPARCGRFPPEVRTAIPVDGRFEHIAVFSCNATSDHAIIWIEREAEKALQSMKEKSSETVTVPPTVQKFERLKTIEKEHKDALERAVSLNVPHAVETEEKEASLSDKNEDEASTSGDKSTSSTQSKSTSARSNWDEVVEKLLKKKHTGDLKLEGDANVTQ